jgi:hypothetical protein
MLPGLIVCACASRRDAMDTPRSDAAPALDTDEVPRQTIAEVQTLEPGELVEGIMTGGRADRAELRVTAAMQFDWNIHSHASGHAMTVHEEFSEVAAEYSFVPTGDGDWFLLIRNSGNVTSDIQVRVDLFGNMQWRWQ